MKKYVLTFFCSLLVVFPSFCSAKKITCNTGNYSATIEIDKEKININDSILIKIESDFDYEVNYRTNNKENIEIDKLGNVKALKEGHVTINTEIDFLEEDVVVNSCTVDLPLEVTSSDSSLKLLTLEEIDISPIFQTDKYEYEIKLPYKFEKINIVAEANNPNAKISGDGRRYLNEGNNEYEVVVTATDGTTTTYKIIIIRENANDDVTLKNLIVEGYVLSPKFDKKVYEYTLNVDKDINEITINAEATYELANLKGIGTHALATGENNIYVIVTAENGSEGKYKITINKNKGSSLLESLEIIDYDLDSEFNKDKFTYYVKINSNVNSLDIKALAYDNDQIEIIGNEELTYGENEIIIRVTGEDKSSTTYKIIADKLSVEEEKEIEKNDMLLKILFIMFVIAIIIMLTVISVFILRNYKINKKNKRKIKNKKK